MFEKVRASRPGVPVGIYSNAILEKIEPVPANVEKGYKPGFRFDFKITEGEHAGSVASRIPNGEQPTDKNALGRFLSEITGIALAEDVDFSEGAREAIGKKFTIVVKQGQGGGTRVETVMPAN